MTSARFLASLVLLPFITLLLTQCSSFVKSPVAGARNKVNTRLPNGLEYSTALTAVKVAIAQAIEAVWTLQKQHPAHPISKLQFKTGNAVLTTTVQRDVTDSGGLTMLIPFSNLAGTQATPGLLAIGRGANSKQVKGLEFSIDPATIQNTDSDKNHVLQDIEINNGLRDALLADFEALLLIKPRSGVTIEPRKISYTFTLAVTRTGTGSIVVSIIPTTPRVLDIGPSIASKRTDTATNDLAITLPLGFPAPTPDAQPVQFFYEVHGSKGSAWIQLPYTEAELAKVIGTRVDKVPEERLPLNQKLLDRLLIPNPQIQGNENKTLPKSSSRPDNPPVLRDPPGF